ncbi:MAG: DUF2341 domain-containing protein, partial [Chitinivibrionales bacterium]|nr:DUF2341 domain-containing protein [Chitinivibrionales bacterium]
MVCTTAKDMAGNSSEVIRYINFAPDEDYSLWNFHDKFHFNTSSNGANVSGNVLNFPVLVRLNNSNFTASQFSQCKNDGSDLRFAKSDGTPISYDIERFDAANSEAEIWVLIDTVYGNNSSQYITMYWGNNSANDKSSPQTVFDTANGYEGVLHFSGTYGFTDATYHQYDGTDIASSDAQGVIGRARLVEMADQTGIKLD